MKDYTKEVPTAHLRFLERDGQRILQQLVQVHSYTGDHVPKNSITQWQDVPLVIADPGEKSHG